MGVLVVLVWLVLGVVGVFVLWYVTALFMLPFTMGWEFVDKESSYLTKTPVVFGTKLMMFVGTLAYVGLTYLAVRGINLEGAIWLGLIGGLVWYYVIPFIIGMVVGKVMKGHVPMVHKQEARIEELEREIKEMRRRGVVGCGVW